MAYLYRHIRLDINQPFYVGIGSDDFFRRATEITRRNTYWNNIVESTAYEVEIILQDLTWEEACKKEKEFIALYGRKDLKKGFLVNHTDGGEGLHNPSEDVRSRKRLSMLGKNSGDKNGMKKLEARTKLSKSRKGKYTGSNSPVARPVECYDLEGNYLTCYSTIIEAERFTGVANPNISKVCKGLRKKAGNYLWKYKN
jgi:hypothetical protein